MKRPSGVMITSVSAFCIAGILALVSFACFFVAVMGMTGADRGEPVSVAIGGMAMAAGFGLLILAGVAAYVAIGLLELREWARIFAVGWAVAGIGSAILDLFAFRGYEVLPAGLSIVCHLVVIAMDVWALVYLFSPQVKEAFRSGASVKARAPLHRPIRETFRVAMRPLAAVFRTISIPALVSMWGRRPLVADRLRADASHAASALRTGQRGFPGD